MGSVRKRFLLSQSLLHGKDTRLVDGPVRTGTVGSAKYGAMIATTGQNQSRTLQFALKY